MKRIRLSIVMIVAATISLQAEVRVSELIDSGNDLRRLAGLVVTGGGMNPERLLAQIDQVAGESSPRRYAARYLKLLAQAELGREEGLAAATEKLRAGPWNDAPYWIEAIRMVTEEGALVDPETRRMALKGKSLLLLVVERGGAPFSGELSWRNVKHPGQGGRVMVEEGRAGPILISPGNVIFSSVVGGRSVDFGSVDLAGWSSVALHLSAPADNQLEILWPEDGDEISDAMPTFRWQYTPGPDETVEVAVARHVDGTTWMTIWGPCESDGNSAAFGTVQAPHEELRVGEVYELVVTVVGPSDPKAGPAAPPQRRSQARRFSYRGE